MKLSQLHSIMQGDFDMQSVCLPAVSAKFELGVRGHFGLLASLADLLQITPCVVRVLQKRLRL